MADLETSHATIDHTGITGVGGALTVTENRISGDVTMTNANQYYDGPSLSLNAGTYLLFGKVFLHDPSAGGGQFTVKLWDGTTVEDSAEVFVAGTGNATLPVMGYVTLGSTATWKVSAAANTAGNLIKAAAVTNGAGNNASVLIAVQVA